MAIKKINYSGNTKVIKRLCEVVNGLIDGGGGGSTVSYQQTLQSGTETGEITIDGVATKMYAPTPPTKVSDLQNDSGFIDGTDLSTALSDYTPTSSLATVATSGSYADLSNKPSIPSDASDITFDDSQCQVISNSDDVQEAIEAADSALNIYGNAIADINLALGNKADDPTTFTEAQTRANIASGESFATILGKIKKWFTDIPTMFVSKSGDTMSGQLNIDRQNGTASSVGGSQIWLGNNISEGTAKNSRGIIRLYGKNSFYAEIYDDAGLTAHRSLYLPNKSGTIALTSDLDSRGTFIELGNQASVEAAWDAITVYWRTVTGTFTKNGVWMFTAYKYEGGQYGMMQAQAYYDTKIYILSVNNGIKTTKVIEGT